MILTEQEVFKCLPPEEDTIAFARAIESAVLEKLKAQAPVAWRYRFGDVWMFDTYRLNGCDADEAVPVFTNPLPPADVVRDAERYRWLRDTLSKSVGGGVDVNDAALVYEDSEPGEEVRVYWYPNTPIVFYESKAETLDAAIDAAMKEMK